jgi:hypothetical protein
MMTKKTKLFWLVGGAYVLLLLTTLIITINHFTQRNFGILFCVITLWPIGRFLLMRHPRVSSWVDHLDQQ